MNATRDLPPRERVRLLKQRGGVPTLRFVGTPVFRLSKDIPELPEWVAGTAEIDFRSFWSFRSNRQFENLPKGKMPP